MTIINFKSEKLKVDYLSFNFQFNDVKQLKDIACWLTDNFKCRVTLIDHLSKKQDLLSTHNQNRYSAEFIVNLNRYWKGSVLRFKGNHAQCFYEDLKLKKMDWSVFVFEDMYLGRFDLCYDRILKTSDTGLDTFFENSLKQINSKEKQLQLYIIIYTYLPC